ncbi:MAG TPA: ATP-binding protein [Candidatus Bathyarchaeia archaeon]|nr:ATP-binding protein [Candidatus Bathyarchaeia archaeon]
MIRLIEAKGYRCLKYVRQSLGPFHVLVGPNASGKTTFLDVIAFLGQLVSDGLDAAIEERTQNFDDLVWQRAGDGFELAIELAIPQEYQGKLGHKDFDVVRYELSIGWDGSERVTIRDENVLLKTQTEDGGAYAQPDLFPRNGDLPRSIIMGTDVPRTQPVVSKDPSNNVCFYAEVQPKQGNLEGYREIGFYTFGPRRTGLGNLPEDETRFPISTWLKRFLSGAVQRFVLNSLLIRKPSPPGKGRLLLNDGSNLPWVIDHLNKTSPDRLKDWVKHLQTALPDLEQIETIERPEDKHRYLMLGYKGGLKVPSWMASDGTLRLLALTLPAYIPELKGIYLIEEPENGIHPLAVQTMFQSLSSVYDAQVLLATHSPLILGLTEPDKVLCFSKTPEGATDIVLGSEHPALKEWRGETDLGTLFAAGVLG